MPTRILVIDDDASIRLSLSYLLRAKGYDTSLAENGAEGFVRFIADRPDIVISDMIMPGQEGTRTIRKIRACDEAVPIIAISGSSRGGPAGFLKQARAAGASHCLEKPFETGELLALLDGLAAAAANGT
jgi:CheY-like chemotaxis protein